jgi:hypothetical protein
MCIKWTYCYFQFNKSFKTYAFSESWKLAEQILSEADRWLFIGYSMPDADSFELFARDFFQDVLKFKIMQNPSRGADGGKDLLVEEQLTGNLFDDKIIWLVSCKHNIHSGKSVSPEIEQNITDRIKQHKADGFISFYSTLASSGLGNRLKNLDENKTVEVFTVCKGRCDNILSHRAKRNGYITRWFDISDLFIPRVYLENLR